MVLWNFTVTLGGGTNSEGRKRSHKAGTSAHPGAAHRNRVPVFRHHPTRILPSAEQRQQMHQRRHAQVPPAGTPPAPSHRSEHRAGAHEASFSHLQPATTEHGEDAPLHPTEGIVEEEGVALRPRSSRFRGPHRHGFGRRSRIA
ncbi:uncharacterized protein L3040_005347 [Drepanopeziza brunnea f. sp. 'multigermtubi']|uniref:uncharacterized protein n=1 Tax=Drepanopeziza brunnea f. sp. 'multigermtubi' TaxID=698441 RepID=UPI00239BFA41|nr:hypothetical protein L3040_005347 [Drepanopeziza brunnea f. sp. 'multigermtubi']